MGAALKRPKKKKKKKPVDFLKNSFFKKKNHWFIIFTSIINIFHICEKCSKFFCIERNPQHSVHCHHQGHWWPGLGQGMSPSHLTSGQQLTWWTTSCFLNRPPHLCPVSLLCPGQSSASGTGSPLWWSLPVGTSQTPALGPPRLPPW